jgi:DNA-binding CsgD family transcriptional regulator
MLRGGDSGMDGAAPSARPTEVFVGRQQELAALTAALDEVSAGEPRFVLIHGEAGIGKSSLIARFLSDCPNVPVVTGSGEESEAYLPYGLVQQLAASGARISPDALSGLELLSHAPPPADADPLAVGVELLALISNLQDGNPVALVIEDLQWIDLASARALLFAFRRLSADRVLVLLSSRAGASPQLGDGWERFIGTDRRVTRLSLSGLGTEEIRTLCRALGRNGLTTRNVQRLADHTAGNPLVTRAVLAELTDRELRAADGSLHAPRSLAEVVAHRLTTLSPAASDVVAAVAVLGDHCSLPEVAEIIDVADPAAALAEAEQAGFLLERQGASGWQISFVHPFFRQAVYQQLGAERRRGLHLRAAAAMAGEAALAHRSAVAVGLDQQLAADLDEASGNAVLAGKLSLAARYRQEAAAVTARGPERDERLLSAFELLIRAADAALADAARPVVEELPASLRRDTALGQLALLTARPLEAQTLLRAAWDARDPVTDIGAGAEAALWLGILLNISGGFTESTIWLNRALASASGNEPWLGAARGMLAVLVTLSGGASKALGLFQDMPERAAMVPLAHTDSVTYRGLVKVWTGDLAGAAEDLALVVSRMQAGLQLRFPGQPLAFLSEAEFRLGRWDDSRGHAELAVSLAMDADRRYDLPFVHSAAVRVPACRGDWPVAGAHIAAAEEAARTFGGFAAIFAASARSILGFARDDPHEALRGAAMALAVPEIDCYDDPSAFWWRPLQIWALIRIGQLDSAATTLAAFESRAAERDEHLALINAAWLQGQFAMARGELDQADRALSKGSALCGSEPFPFHRGLLRLEHGKCLSRLQQRKAAISAFRSADEIFTGLGAHPFTQGARLQLAELGVRARHGDDTDLGGLTVQELRVARAVAAGLSNREVASQLYLSPKTVEFHLSSVFAKLGLSSRHQLAARIPDRDVPAIALRRATTAQGKTQGNHRSQGDG